jgi:hypothetical protein
MEATHETPRETPIPVNRARETAEDVPNRDSPPSHGKGRSPLNSCAWFVLSIVRIVRVEIVPEWQAVWRSRSGLIHVFHALLSDCSVFATARSMSLWSTRWSALSQQLMDSSALAAQRSWNEVAYLNLSSLGSGSFDVTQVFLQCASHFK